MRVDTNGKNMTIQDHDLRGIYLQELRQSTKNICQIAQNFQSEANEYEE
jgi:hypothetical protein